MSNARRIIRTVQIDFVRMEQNKPLHLSIVENNWNPIP